MGDNIFCIFLADGFEQRIS